MNKFPYLHFYMYESLALISVSLYMMHSTRLNHYETRTCWESFGFSFPYAERDNVLMRTTPSVPVCYLIQLYIKVRDWNVIKEHEYVTIH